MTEQEQIEKMASVIFDTSIDEEMNVEFYDVYEFEFAEQIAKCVVKAGYRKADEVRKETAREILQQVMEFLNNQSEAIKIMDVVHKIVRVVTKFHKIIVEKD